MLPFASFALVAALGTPSAPESCAVLHKRAATVGHVQTQDGGEGSVQQSATRTFQGSQLTFAYMQSTVGKPNCSGQVLTFTRPGFAFERGADPTYEAMSAVFSNDVCQDFVHSKFVAQTKLADQTRDKRALWYAGKMYGYATVRGSGSLQVIPLADFRAQLARANDTSATVH